MIKQLAFAALAAAVAGTATFGMAGSDPADAAETNWKMHIVWVPARPEAQAYQQFADKVTKEAGDALDMTLFTSGSLGIKDADMLRILPRGNIIQAAGLYPGYLTRDKPAIRLHPAARRRRAARKAAGDPARAARDLRGDL